MTHGEISAYLRGLGVDTHKQTSGANSKWVFVKDLLADSASALILRIADELEIPHKYTVTPGRAVADSSFWEPCRRSPWIRCPPGESAPPSTAAAAGRRQSSRPSAVGGARRQIAAITPSGVRVGCRWGRDEASSSAGPPALAIAGEPVVRAPRTYPGGLSRVGHVPVLLTDALHHQGSAWSVSSHVSMNSHAGHLSDWMERVVTPFFPRQSRVNNLIRDHSWWSSRLTKCA